MSAPAPKSPSPSIVGHDTSNEAKLERGHGNPTSNGVDDEGPTLHSGLEDYERQDTTRPPFYLTVPEVKLIGIAGVGFFLDAYDLFIINPVATMLQFRLFGGKSIPAGPQGVLKASANIGSVIGQFTFGYLADAFGRKAVYGKELMLIIFATIMCLTTPTGQISPLGSIYYLTAWRIILGIGVGGDCPMSASVTSDRANIRKRGTMLAYIFANQGWGSLVGSLATMIVLLCYKDAMQNHGETSKVDGAWRITIGLSLIPAFGTLYARLTLPESKRFKESKRIEDERASLDSGKSTGKPGDFAEKDGFVNGKDIHGVAVVPAPAVADNGPGLGAASHEHLVKTKKTHFMEFVAYFSEWQHFKILLGTCSCWFFLDIAFHGINLNQNVVLAQIGFGGTTGTAWERLWDVGVGNLIVTALGFVPGYYVTVLTVEWLGRKPIQIMGFLMEALMLAILAGKFHTLSTVAFTILFALLQFFFNFGANATTYIYPAEVFPTRFKAQAHGMSAACGKAGAIISALVFNELSQHVGTSVVLWIFFGCCIAGAICTLLLPEVKGRDTDAIDAEEMRVQRGQKGYNT